jgi:hydroxyethylthiazole kinase-like uncharacterized protein yjeF
VLDAGALTILAASRDLQDVVIQREFPTVVTPHEGEFARLCTTQISLGRIDAAKALATQLKTIVVLKGPGTIVAGPKGAVFVDLGGTPALATAGSGDVLAGLIGALLSGATARSDQALSQAEVAEVAAAAVWLHSQAGRVASSTGFPVTATQIVAALPAAIAQVRRPTRLSL